MVTKSFRLLAVIVGAVGITALGLDAADTWRGASGTLLGQLAGSQMEVVCEEGMVTVTAGQTFRCIDRYEVTASEDCPVAEPAGPYDTEVNLRAEACVPVSRANAIPWRFVSRDDAARLCARVGKRLPSAEEWYGAALNTPDTPCMGGDGLAKTGMRVGCVSSAGAHDMVGNLWEWVADDVFSGHWAGRVLPSEGYVEQVDRAGVATVTGSTSAHQSFDRSYFWSESVGVYGMIRGGFYGSRADAGVATVHAATPPTFTGEAVGFRCVR
jgi:formylglycine-generating enzyme required for sulfatase activity